MFRNKSPIYQFFINIQRDFENKNERYTLKSVSATYPLNANVKLSICANERPRTS
jgi:hypothetical protein